MDHYEKILLSLTEVEMFYTLVIVCVLLYMTRQYLKWLCLLPCSIVFTLVAYVAAFFLPFFSDSDGWLPRWLWWFQTPDNSLDGDGGWKTEHWQWRFKLPAWLCIYVGRVGWMLRNPAYGFEWDGPLCAKISPDAEVSFSGDTKIANRPNGKEGYCYTQITNPDGSTYWHFYYVKAIGGGRCFNLNLGWKLKTYAEVPSRIKDEPKAMYTFSPRFTEFLP